MSNGNSTSQLSFFSTPVNLQTLSTKLCFLKGVQHNLPLTEVTVVELAWLDPDGGAGAEMDAQTDHVVQLKVGKGWRDVAAAG